MRLRDYTGTVRDVDQIIAAVEERRTFNNSKRRVLEPCKDASVQPNALVFIVKPSNVSGVPFGMSMSSDENLLVGNLKPEVAEQILTEITEKGYADISGLTYQKDQFMPEQCKFDNGASDPYYYKGYGIFQSAIPGCGSTVNIFETECTDQADDDEEEDLSKFSDEELRGVLYELADYTFLQLGQMTREELEIEYAMQKGEP